MTKPQIILYKSNRKEKKYVLDLGYKRIHFGQKGYRDFTLLNDKTSSFYEPDFLKREKVKLAYLKRHKNDILDEISPGSASWFILWNKKDIKSSLKDFEKEFDVKVKDVSDIEYEKTLI